ncbi:MAG: hypothetical protein HQ582_29275 [Planctomycetes bacterium]|nr:hypothetical protein [Planctomycetota bacterium]
MTHARLALKAAALYLPYRLRDARCNRRHRAAQKRFLVVRHSGKQPYRYRYFLDWLAEEFPEVRARFELRLLPCRIRDWAGYALHVPWLQDPVEEWTPWGYRQSLRVAAECDENGIPIINRVDRLSNSIKSIGARLMRRAGVRTPRIFTIDNVARFREDCGGLELPLLIREDRGHGKPTFLIERASDLDRAPLARFSHPIAVEYVDVQAPDGLYRKYRCMAAGETGVARHLMISNHWETRPKSRVRTDATRDEELEYLNHSDPNRDALQVARRALGLDLVAFDYSYDRLGRLVVWEANPYPDLSFPHHPAMSYISAYVRRSFAAVARLYLRRAGLPVPGRLDELLAGQDRETPSPIDACPAKPSHAARTVAVGQGDGDP